MSSGRNAQTNTTQNTRPYGQRKTGARMGGTPHPPSAPSPLRGGEKADVTLPNLIAQVANVRALHLCRAAGERWIGVARCDSDCAEQRRQRAAQFRDVDGLELR